jgi:signal transduction histidine kinase
VNDAIDHARYIFATGLAHELRTPLTILKGRLHGLEDGVIDPATDECSRLLRQVDQLLRIVDDLGILAKAQARKLALDWRSVDLLSIVEYAVGDVRPEAEAARIDIAITATPMIVRCDPARLIRALTTLFRFALSRMAPEQSLTIGTGDDNHLLITIRGNDLKCARGQEHLLFAPFYDSGADGRSVASTSGVGPALAAALIHAHGGTITASRTDGGSLEIHISLHQDREKAGGE